jgi:glycosyltransferase involved in cell wall biosynthesis
MKIGYLMQEGCPDIRNKPLTGPANHVVNVVRELERLGHNVALLTRYDGKIWKSSDLETFEPVKVLVTDQRFPQTVERVLRGLQSRLRLPYLNWFESRRFAEACFQTLSDCEIFYERMGWMGFGGGMAAKKMDIPLVLEANNGNYLTEMELLGVAPYGFQRYISIKLMRKAFSRTSLIVATGEGHRNRFIETYQVDPELVTIVENGSEIVKLLKRDQLIAFKEPVDIHSPVNIVFVGAFERWHGIIILLSAFVKVVEHYPDTQLVLIGSGTQRDEIGRAINKFNLGTNVKFTGQIDIHQVAHHLSRAHIGVAPYCGWMEYSGLKLFDYKAAGLAIIASGENGQPSALEHGRTGWIVPPGDVDALAQSFLCLLSDSELRRRMGREARIEAENQHSWRHTVIRLQEIFRQVLSS